MRFVLTADWHIHPWRECSRDNGQDRLQDGLSAARQCLQAARNRKCPLVVGGDVKHAKDRWLVSVLNGVRALFAEYEDVPKLVLHGNHDGVGGGKSGLEALRGLPQTLVAEDPFVCRLPPTMLSWKEPVAFWPFQPTLDGLPDFLDRARKAKARVLFGHAFLAGAAVGPNGVDIRKGVPLEALGLAAGKERVFDWAFVGDVHRQQMLSGGWTGKGKLVTHGMISAPQVWYPGDPCAQNWGELERDKGCLFVDTDAGKVERLPIQAPRFIVEDWVAEHGVTWKGDVNERLDWDTKVCAGELGSPWKGHFVRLVVPAQADPQRLERLREASGARSFQVTVRRAASVEQRTELHAGMSLAQLVREYVAARPPEGLKPKDVVAAGLRLLEER